LLTQVGGVDVVAQGEPRASRPYLLPRNNSQCVISKTGVMEGKKKNEKERYGLDAVGSLSNHIHAAHLGEQVGKLLAGQLFVVDDERGRGSCGAKEERSLIVGRLPRRVNCGGC